MRVEGACRCAKVRFTVESDAPYPFISSCGSLGRKTSGAVTSTTQPSLGTSATGSRR